MSLAGHLNLYNFNWLEHMAGGHWEQ